MNLKKLTKLALSAAVVAPAVAFVAGCSDDDDPVAGALPPGTPVPESNSINGVWDGTFSRTTTAGSVDYEVGMLFYKAELEARGTSGGVALGDGPLNDALTEDPHFLFEGGFQFFDQTVTSTDPDTLQELIICEVPNPLYPSDDGGVWAVGRFGNQGTFVQEFEYETGSAAGPDQRAAGCFYKNLNKLTGEIQFEEAGKLFVDMTYSLENANDRSVADLGTVGNDGSGDQQYHLWSNDNSGISMSYTTVNPNTIDQTAMAIVVEDRADAVVCGGTLNIAKVANNVFTVATAGTLDVGCNVAFAPAPDVVLEFSGLGTIVDDDEDGTADTFVHIMKSEGSGAGITAHALFNEFTITP